MIRLPLSAVLLCALCAGCQKSDAPAATTGEKGASLFRSTTAPR